MWTLHPWDPRNPEVLKRLAVPEDAHKFLGYEQKLVAIGESLVAYKFTEDCSYIHDEIEGYYYK